jgi:hypothetical protein
MWMSEYPAAHMKMARLTIRVTIVCSQIHI